MHYIILFMAKDAIIVVGLIAAIYWLTLPKKDKDTICHLWNNCRPRRASIGKSGWRNVL